MPILTGLNFDLRVEYEGLGYSNRISYRVRLEMEDMSFINLACFRHSKDGFIYFSDLDSDDALINFFKETVRQKKGQLFNGEFAELYMKSSTWSDREAEIKESWKQNPNMMDWETLTKSCPELAQAKFPSIEDEVIFDIEINSCNYLKVNIGAIAYRLEVTMDKLVQFTAELEKEHKAFMKWVRSKRKTTDDYTAITWENPSCK